MKPSVSEEGARSVSAEKVMHLVSEMLRGGYPNPEDTSPPGPWDPYIRRALDRLGWALGHPVPWKHILGPQPEPWRIAALNPQLLPTRIAFMLSLSQDVVDRAALIHEVAEGIGQPGEKQGIIIVGGLISRFVDDWCGTSWRPKWPFPGPPPWWWQTELSGLELIVLGTQFVHSARQTVDKSLQDQLQKAGAQFNEAGMERM